MSTEEGWTVSVDGSNVVLSMREEGRWMYLSHKPHIVVYTPVIRVMLLGLKSYSIELKECFSDWTAPTESEITLWDLEYDFPYLTKKSLDSYFKAL